MSSRSNVSVETQVRHCAAGRLMDAELQTTYSTVLNPFPSACGVCKYALPSEVGG